MEKADIKNHVLEYALNRETPFTAAIAFESIDAIETAKQVSDSLGRLYHERILARRRVDKVRYEYINASIRPAGFEMAPDQPAAEQKTTEPEKKKMGNLKNIGISAEEAVTGLHQIAKLTTSCPPLKEPDTPEKTSEPKTLKIEYRQPTDEQKPEQQPEQQPEKQKHSHYFVDVSRYNTIDIYRITESYQCSQMAAHITKKALCSGARGHKDLTTDIKEIIDTANRWLEMIAEDGGNN